MTTFSPLAFQASGPANAPSIVFLHGGGGGGWMWRAVAQSLPEYHCLIPDLPEHGSSRHIGPFSMPLAAQKTAELIREQANGGKACVVGLSEGAQVAVQLLAEAPELVEKALASSALLRPLPGMGWAASPRLLAWAYRVSIPPFRNNDGWIRLNMKYAAGIPEAYYTDFKQEFRQTTESGFVNLMRANQRFRLPAGLEKADLPVLAVAGKREYAAMRRSVRDLVAALPCATGGLVNLGKGSSLAKEHNWAMTAPELFARSVRAWIEDGPLPPEIEAL